jgi:PAS domain S-box-containing protein
MKIRTQLIISVVLFVIALLIISVSVYTTNQQIDQLIRQGSLVNNIELGAGELGYLSNDYLLFHEPQQFDRWNLKYASVSDDLSNLRVDRPEQQALVDNIKANQQRLKEVFYDIVSTVERKGHTQDNTIDPAYIQLSWSRLAVQSRGITFDAASLSQMLRDEENQARQTNTLLITGLMGAFIIFLLIDYLLIYGRTIKSIEILQSGTRIIGSGNLDHSLQVKKHDEIGDLADSFNQMVVRLKAVTASKTDLESEISRRRQTEKALQEKQEALQIQAEELVAINEELSANNEELFNSQAALMVSEADLAKAQSVAHIGSWSWNVKTNEIEWSDEQFRLFGFEPREVHPSWDVFISHVHPDDRERMTKKVKEFIDAKGDIEYIIDLRIIRNDGSIIYTRNLSDKLTFDKEGNPVKMFGTTQDITEIKKAEEELKEAKDQAELYLDLMGHDISNMHQIAMSQLELAQETLAEEGKLECDEKELIDTPLNTLERSAKLIDNVRKLQKLKAGEYKPEVIDLGTILTDVVTENSKILNKDVTINYNHAQGYLVKANPLLKDVFTNLVGNAIKHSNSRTTIDIEVNKINDSGLPFYKVTVEDNGPGIPDSKKEEVFHRFKRGQTQARGIGLGLYIVKTLVESFHGRVTVEDRVPGDYTKGSRFSVYLPVAEDEHGK